MRRHHYLKPTLALHPEGTNLQVEATVFQNSLSQCWDVNACITLACEKKLILAVLWEKSEKFLEGQVVVHGHLENTCAKEGSKKVELIHKIHPPQILSSYLSVIGCVFLVIRIGEADTCW